MSSFVREISDRKSCMLSNKVSSNLSKESLGQNVLFLHATNSHGKARLTVWSRSSMRSISTCKIESLLLRRISITMQTVVKEHLVQTDRIQWDVAQEVMTFLEVDQVRFALEPVFANSRMKKDLQRETKKFATNNRNTLSMIIRNSLGLTQRKPELKAGLSKTVDDIARHFLDTAAVRLSREFYIFIALLRYITRENPTLINRDEPRPHKGQD
ncbi:hypothetical protein M422DRAFT_246140 [Sphaerobolus stellatus SS14]|nr:hypothetical protein M422DRAFT_246140 [Sphaerobolus stellatus SS14]